MSKPIDRTYRTDPATFSAALTQQITQQAEHRYAKWKDKGRLPLFIRIKNRLSLNN